MAQYTANYQLHQWEAGDNFLRTDFNQDFAKIDTAIKAVENKAKTDTQALTASTNTQFQTLTAKAATAPVVLGKKTLTANNRTLSITGLQSKNPGQYDFLRLLVWGKAAGTFNAYYYMHINGVTDDTRYMNYRDNNQSSNKMIGVYLGNCQKEDEGGSISDISFYPAGNNILLWGRSLGCSDSTVYSQSTRSIAWNFSFAGMKSVELVVSNPETTYFFLPGSKAILLGYKF